MKQKYGIGLFILSIVIIYLTSSYFYGTQKTDIDTSEIRKSVTADGQAFRGDCYYLYERNGYVVVYLSDRKTIFEYTDIIFQDLPELLKKEIKNGKYIPNEEELYGFLENYTS